DADRGRVAHAEVVAGADAERDAVAVQAAVQAEIVKVDRAMVPADERFDAGAGDRGGSRRGDGGERGGGGDDRDELLHSSFLLCPRKQGGPAQMATVPRLVIAFPDRGSRDL